MMMLKNGFTVLDLIEKLSEMPDWEKDLEVCVRGDDMRIVPCNGVSIGSADDENVKDVVVLLCEDTPIKEKTLSL